MTGRKNDEMNDLASSSGRTVDFESTNLGSIPSAETIERMAVAALHGWNGIPTNGTFEWPRDFPEGSREAWKRSILAAMAAL